MRFRELFEAPITDLGFHGDPNVEGGFRPQDLRAMNNPKWIEKVRDLYRRAPFDFNIYLYNAPEGKTDLLRFKELWPDYQGDPLSPFAQAITSQQADVRDIAQIHAYAGEVDAKRVEPILGGLPENQKSAINAILMSNEGDQRMALTPWMVGHRLVHAIVYAQQREGHPDNPTWEEVRKTYNAVYNDLLYILRTYSNEHSNRLYDPKLDPVSRNNEVAKIMGTTRAARSGKHINEFEWLIDMSVQWLINGTVKFQRPQIDQWGYQDFSHIKETPLLQKVRKWVKEIAVHKYGRGYTADHFIDDTYDVIPEPFPDHLRYQPDYITMTVYRGRTMIARGQYQPDLTYDRERVQHWKDQGCRVEFMTGPERLAQEQKLYQRQQATFEKIRKEYRVWEAEGVLHPNNVGGTPTKKLHDAVTSGEKNLGVKIQAMFAAAVGRFFIL